VIRRREGDHPQSHRPDGAHTSKASGSVNRSSGAESVRYMSVPSVVQRRTLTSQHPKKSASSAWPGKTQRHFIQRVHRQRTGYWHFNGDGVEQFTPAELAAAADLLGGQTAAAFHTAGAELARRGEHALALRICDLGLLSHPGAPELSDLRQAVLQPPEPGRPRPADAVRNGLSGRIAAHAHERT
jgi:hypothetical protein